MTLNYKYIYREYTCTYDVPLRYPFPPWSILKTAAEILIAAVLTVRFSEKAQDLIIEPEEGQHFNTRCTVIQILY